MAKTCQIHRDLKRKKMIAAQKEKRAKLRKIIKDPNVSEEEQAKALHQMQTLPRNGAPTRDTNRCIVSGRARAVYKKFGLSRIAFREMALQGKLPGVTKASW